MRFPSCTTNVLSSDLAGFTSWSHPASRKSSGTNINTLYRWAGEMISFCTSRERISWVIRTREHEQLVTAIL